MDSKTVIFLYILENVFTPVNPIFPLIFIPAPPMCRFFGTGLAWSCLKRTHNLSRNSWLDFVWGPLFQNRVLCMKSNWWPTMETGRVTAPRDWCHWQRKAWVTKALVSMITDCPGKNFQQLLWVNLWTLWKSTERSNFNW